MWSPATPKGFDRGERLSFQIALTYQYLHLTAPLFFPETTEHSAVERLRLGDFLMTTCATSCNVEVWFVEQMSAHFRVPGDIRHTEKAVEPQCFENVKKKMTVFNPWAKVLSKPKDAA